MDLSSLSRIRAADAECFDLMVERLRSFATPPTSRVVDRLVEETVWALTEEIGFGRDYARGLLRLADKAPDRLEDYSREVREAARTGTTLAGIIANHLVAVTIHGEPLIERFSRTIAVMRAKGTYTLSGPLPVLTQLIESGELESALGYLDLLEAVFSQPLSYNPSSRFSYLLPESVSGFPHNRRPAHIAQLTRVTRADLRLIDPFLDGLRNGLGSLSTTALADFVGQALERSRENFGAGQAFLAVASDAARTAMAALQKAAALPQAIDGVRRYLHARLGKVTPVRSMAELTADSRPEGALVCSDGRAIFLADELELFDRRELNHALYKTLAALEACLLEAGSYDFDLQRAMDRYPEVGARRAQTGAEPAAPICDAERLIRGFTSPALADDLFWMLELSRVMSWMAGAYPGLWAKARRLLSRQAVAMGCTDAMDHPLRSLYRYLILGEKPEEKTILADFFRDQEYLRRDSTVETSAAGLCRVYAIYSSAMGDSLCDYHLLPMPFGWRPHWSLLSAAQAPRHAVVERIVRRMAEQGISIYRSELHRRLDENGGAITAAEIKALIISRVPGGGPTVAIDWSKLDLEMLLKNSGAELSFEENTDATALRYPEWNHQLQDYLREHVALYEREPAAVGDDSFYADTLERHYGLVARTRRAFELLKPERLKMLRPWEEGDDCDYRALLDYAVDRRLGRQPSERLFIKRLKQDRDVAVLLLVDISRSTANPVIGGSASVLDVAKEALVIFCEALLVVGDTFAAAAFSGSGRHAVNYFPIKEFADPLAGPVKQRIAALQPQRSTRMGAAIRHATTQLAGRDARAKLLILVSDGFPNDLGYKGEYAIADTRRAVQEARARHIHVKAITVNIGSDPRLDDLYGRRHHHVIGDVRELPGKLLRLYGTLTRH